MNMLSHRLLSLMLSILLALVFQQTFGMEIEFRDPKDGKLTVITYQDTDYDVQKFRQGKAPVVVWYNMHQDTEAYSCIAEVDKQLKNFSEWDKSDPISRLIESHKTQDGTRNLRYYLQKLALISWGTPDSNAERIPGRKISIHFGICLENIINHALSQATLPIQKERDQYHRWWNEDYKGNNEAKAKIKCLQDQLQKATTKTQSLKQKSEDDKKEIARLTKKIFKAIVYLDELEEDRNFYRNQFYYFIKQEQEQENERESSLKQIKDLRRQIAQQSQQSAQDYAAVRSQLSPLRERAQQVSPLRRTLQEKDTEIENLKRELEKERKRNSYASVVRGQHLRQN